MGMVVSVVKLPVNQPLPDWSYCRAVAKAPWSYQELSDMFLLNRFAIFAEVNMK